MTATDSRGEPTRFLGAKDVGRQLAGYHAYHATRADLLRRPVRSQKSCAAYDKAIQLAGNTPRPPTRPAATS